MGVGGYFPVNFTLGKYQKVYNSFSYSHKFTNLPFLKFSLLKINKQRSQIKEGGGRDGIFFFRKIRCPPVYLMVKSRVLIFDILVSSIDILLDLIIVLVIAYIFYTSNGKIALFQLKDEHFQEIKQVLYYISLTDYRCNDKKVFIKSRNISWLLE